MIYEIPKSVHDNEVVKLFYKTPGLAIPIRRRQFFGRISQNSEYVKTHCKGVNKPFHFACR